jgi:hypothetical protein
MIQFAASEGARRSQKPSCRRLRHPRHQVVSLVDLREQPRNVGRVVLQVAVDRDDDVAARVLEARRERRGLAEVLAQREHSHVGIFGVDRAQDLARAVGRAIVHVDDLVGMAGLAQGRYEFRVERTQVVALVADRNDDGDLHRLCSRLIRGSRSAP